jgi:hypothetical protein
MEEHGWTFYRLMPAPLQTWRIVAASFLFVCFIFGIVIRLRRKAENAGSLRLDAGYDRSDSQRLTPTNPSTTRWPKA